MKRFAFIIASLLLSFGVKGQSIKINKVDDDGYRFLATDWGDIRPTNSSDIWQVSLSAFHRSGIDPIYFLDFRIATPNERDFGEGSCLSIYVNDSIVWLDCEKFSSIKKQNPKTRKTYYLNSFTYSIEKEDLEYINYGYHGWYTGWMFEGVRKLEFWEKGETVEPIMTNYQNDKLRSYLRRAKINIDKTFSKSF